jgi:hypothetical protein
MLVSTYKFTRRHNPQDQNRHVHHRENLKSHANLKWSSSSRLIIPSAVSSMVFPAVTFGNCLNSLLKYAIIATPFISIHHWYFTLYLHIFTGLVTRWQYSDCFHYRNLSVWITKKTHRTLQNVSKMCSRYIQNRSWTWQAILTEALVDVSNFHKRIPGWLYSGL